MGKILKYARRDMIYLINNIARGIANENDGKIDDVFRIDMLLKQELVKNPERIDLDKYVKDCRKVWWKLNHEVLIPHGATGVTFVPGSFLALGERSAVMMKKASVPDIVAWQLVDDDATTNFLRTVNMRTEYRNRVLSEFARNRDCHVLGDIEAKLHGYVEKENDETAHLDITTPEADSDAA